MVLVICLKCLFGLPWSSHRWLSVVFRVDLERTTTQKQVRIAEPEAILTTHRTTMCLMWDWSPVPCNSDHKILSQGEINIYKCVYNWGHLLNFTLRRPFMKAYVVRKEIYAFCTKIAAHMRCCKAFLLVLVLWSFYSKSRKILLPPKV